MSQVFVRGVMGESYTFSSCGMTPTPDCCTLWYNSLMILGVFAQGDVENLSGGFAYLYISRSSRGGLDGRTRSEGGGSESSLIWASDMTECVALRFLGDDGIMSERATCGSEAEVKLEKRRLWDVRMVSSEHVRFELARGDGGGELKPLSHLTIVLSSVPSDINYRHDRVVKS